MDFRIVGNPRPMCRQYYHYKVEWLTHYVTINLIRLKRKHIKLARRHASKAEKAIEKYERKKVRPALPRPLSPCSSEESLFQKVRVPKYMVHELISRQCKLLGEDSRTTPLSTLSSRCDDDLETASVCTIPLHEGNEKFLTELLNDPVLLETTLPTDIDCLVKGLDAHELQQPQLHNTS